MTGAHCVDVCQLHKLDVLEHGFNIDSTTLEGMSILGINTLEVYLLTVDVNAMVIGRDFDVTETVLGCESFFFLAICIELSYLNGVEVGVLCTPKLEIRKIIEGYILNQLISCVGCKVELCGLLGYLCAIGGNKAYANLLAYGLTFLIINGEGYIHATALITVFSIEG